MDTSKGSERINDEGAAEIKVETVDHRSPAGENQEPKDEKVEIAHVIPSDDKPGTRKAVGKVVENVQSGSERINDEGAVEIKVETVDHRSPAGEKQEPKDEKVEITHVIPSDDEPGTRKAVGKVVENVQSAISKTQKTE